MRPFNRYEVALLGAALFSVGYLAGMWHAGSIDARYMRREGAGCSITDVPCSKTPPAYAPPDNGDPSGCIGFLAGIDKDGRLITLGKGATTTANNLSLPHDAVAITHEPRTTTTENRHYGDDVVIGHDAIGAPVTPWAPSIPPGEAGREVVRAVFLRP